MFPSKASERLQAARKAAAEGRHEQALAEYIWFHEHALEDDPAQAGVRLSFALSYWSELAQAYPPARAKLAEIRDAKAALLRNGEHVRGLMMDVVAIDTELGQQEHAHALLRDLLDVAPEFLDECGSRVLGPIFAQSDYDLAARLLKKPEAYLRRQAEDADGVLRSVGERYPDRVDEFIDPVAQRYAGDMRNVLAMLEHAGRPEEAQRLRELGPTLVDERIRSRLSLGGA